MPSTLRVSETRPPQTFDIVAARHDLARFVRSLASRWGLREEIDDLVQDALCRVLERERLPGASSFGRLLREGPAWQGYLRRVARSVLIDMLRARSATKRLHEFGLRVQVVDLDGLIRNRPGDDPEHRLLAREQRRLFAARCIAALPRRGSRTRDLRILRWAWLEGWSSREIEAELQGELSSPNIDALLHRVRIRLRQVGIQMPPRTANPRVRPVTLTFVCSDRYPEPKSSSETSGF